MKRAYNTFSTREIKKVKVAMSFRTAYVMDIVF